MSSGKTILITKYFDILQKYEKYTIEKKVNISSSDKIKHIDKLLKKIRIIEDYFSNNNFEIIYDNLKINWFKNVLICKYEIKDTTFTSIISNINHLDFLEKNNSVVYPLLDEKNKYIIELIILYDK